MVYLLVHDAVHVAEVGLVWEVDGRHDVEVHLNVWADNRRQLDMTVRIITKRTAQRRMAGHCAIVEDGVAAAARITRRHLPAQHIGI